MCLVIKMQDIYFALNLLLKVVMYLLLKIAVHLVLKVVVYLLQKLHGTYC